MNNLEVNFLQEIKEGEAFLLNRIILIKIDTKTNIDNIKVRLILNNKSLS